MPGGQGLTSGAAGRKSLAMHRIFALQTRGPGLTEFTAPVAEWLCARPRTGVLTLMVRHTSASLLIQENADPDVQADLQAFFARLVPPADDPAMGWITHRDEGPDDMPAHIKAALLPISLQIPVIDGRMGLGTWQGIYLFEHRRAPMRREVLAMLVPAAD